MQKTLTQTNKDLHSRQKEGTHTMLISITTKKYTCEIDFVSQKNMTLKAGATLGIESPSLDAPNKTLRATHTTGNTLNVDLTFKSTSACASFIVGSPQSGNRFFAKYLGSIPKTATPTPKPSVESTEATPTPTPNKTSTLSIDKNKLAKDIVTFCKDFEFSPDNRCLNTMKYVKDTNDYLLSFMELTNYPQELIDKAKNKFKSIEWKSLIKTLKDLPNGNKINHRLIIKYGSAGTGKTTDALAQYPNAKKIVASASADPDDLFTRFNPSTKSYELTELGRAMQDGKAIIIDELNLYNVVCLQRLQGVLDNTSIVTDRGIDINIKDGFKVIATMNLSTNLGKTPLPNPLVSRAENIENYDSRVNVDLSWVW